MYVFNLQTKGTIFCVYSARPGDQIIVLRIKYIFKEENRKQH